MHEEITLDPTEVKGDLGELTLSDVKDVFALKGKNAGCSLKLRGKVVLIAFLVNDGESRWDAASQEKFVASLKEISNRLMDESGLNKEQLQIAYAYKQVDIPYIVNRKNDSNCMHDVLRQFGYSDVQSYQKHYEEKFERDETAITFVFNKEFRSHAFSADKSIDDPEAVDPIGDEYSFVSFCADDVEDSSRGFIHELMHQFGAIDYYYPENIAVKANMMLPGSIMNGGNNIDDLTRYIIGWDDEPSTAALNFLKSISDIPIEEIKHALISEWLD